MSSVHLAGISISFGPRQLLEEVNFSISTGDRIALSGANGSGKSTLMRIIAGEIKPDSGKVTIGKDTRVSYLPQSGISFPDISVRAGAEKAFDEMNPVIEEMKACEEKLGTSVKETPETALLLEHYNYLHERIMQSNYYTRDAIIHKVLTGLGFSEKDFIKPINQFSSGWQMRIALAKVLLERPDIMLLDEPTNYLDIEARTWLEDYLVSYTGGILIVSHDRFFLDTTVNRIAEIYLRKVSFYTGNYSEYEKKMTEQMARAMDAYNQQQDEIAKVELFIKRFRYNSSKAKLVQSRIQYLKNMELLEKPPGSRSIHFSFLPPPRSGDIVLEVKDVNKSYGNIQALNNINLTITRGERLVLAGPNGAGKSTLMRILSGLETPDSGSVVHGKNVSTGYFSQDQIEETPSTLSIIEEFESLAPTPLIPHLRNLLGSFLFTGDDIHKSISVLSGGEKSRILLLKLLMHPANLLLLDEPTNHLDMVSKNILLDALKNYSATLIFVSHDRYFIQSLATKVLELREGNGRLYYGDYEYYLYRRAEMEKGEGDTTSGAEELKPKEIKKSTITHEEDKKRKNRLKNLKEEEEMVLHRSETAQKEIEALELLLSEESIYTDGEKVKEVKEKIRVKQHEYEEFLARWEKIEEELNELASLQ
ncbi:MAG: ABC-F family ATP-binding cassette domain-containing protein [Spirochaetales bacterium]|nr:ABC-F family ATP-binding cassette domain-containing protein [Spirochaetales bacterium]